MVGIIDYGMGNLLSVRFALERIGADVLLCESPDQIKSVDKIVLPGVGAFRDCMGNLRKKGFVAPLEEAVFQEKKPILGICMGMEIMAKKSFEGGEFQGLGWFDAEVRRIDSQQGTLSIPHIGWSEVDLAKGNSLFQGLPPKPDFYFVHSYWMQCNQPSDILGTCEYGTAFTAVIGKKNIFGTQFHPEKSQDYGIKLLDNFLHQNG